MMKKLSAMLLLLLPMVFGISNAQAADAILCTPLSGLNFSPAVGSQLFPRDAPVGTTSAPFSTLLNVSCTTDPVANLSLSIQIGTYDGVLVPGQTAYFQTDVAGIGVRYIYESGDGTSTCKPYIGNFPAEVLSTRRNVVCSIKSASAGTLKTFALKVSAIFMKTSSGPTGTLSKIPTVYNEVYYDNSKNLTIWANGFSGVATGTFAVAACTVTTSSIAVTMPKTYTYRLPNVGSTDGETSLNIGLNCDPGTKVYTTLTDVSTPENTTTTLSLSPDSTAQGIGYQILYNATPVKFGVDSSVPGNPGQFVLTPAPTTGGVLSVPLTARYIRTGKIGSGSVNAKATFTMSYQ